MDVLTILAAKFKGQCKFISVRASDSFHSIQSQVIGKWAELQNFSFSFSCFVGDFENVALECDDDLINIRTISSNLALKLVTAVVCEVSPTPPNDQRPAIPSSSISGSNDNEASEFCAPFPFPNYDVCPAVPKNAYLSDNWSDLFKSGVGEVFHGGSDDFKVSLRKYATKMGFRFKFMRNNAEYIHVICRESITFGCEWYIRSKFVHGCGAFIIYKANFSHKCVGMLYSDKTKRLCPKIIGKLVIGEVKSNPDMGGKEVDSFFHNAYGYEISYHRAYRAVESAKEQLYGSYDDSYGDLRWYTAAVQRTNPGSIVELQENTTSHCFERLFIAFNACVKGFKFCRPLLFIDGTFLRGRAKGTLLVATAKDGNDGLFPVEFALVSAENTSNWEWFIRKIKENIRHEREIIYISDRNTGILSALNSVFKEPNHFYCFWHLLNNLKGRFSSGWTNNQREDLGDLFRLVVYAPDERIFNQKMDLFKHVGGKRAEEWVAQLPYEKWAVAYSPHIKRYGEMTSNAAESVNSWIVEARSLPVTKMLDWIRQNTAAWFVRRRLASNQWTTPLVPKKQTDWDNMFDTGKSWVVALSPSGVFEVHSNVSCTVDLMSQKCSCGQWYVTGFPCVHAVTVISRNFPPIFTYVDKYFYSTLYALCYKEDIQPIPDTVRFECEPPPDHPKLLPPSLKRKPSRPKKQRNPSYGEYPKKKLKLCGLCGKRGVHDPRCIQSQTSTSSDYN